MAEIPVNKMYEQRKDFLIVALTGITGSGCSDLAETMSKEFAEWEDIRGIDNLKGLQTGDKQDLLFHRKYELCHNVCLKQYKPFIILKYSKILLLYTVEYLAFNKDSYQDFLSEFVEIIKKKFDKSHEIQDDVLAEDYVVNNLFSFDDLVRFGLTEYIYNELKRAKEELNQKHKRNYQEILYSIFENKSFSDFSENLLNEMKARDYYAKNFFIHRLAVSIRATGNPSQIIDKENKNHNTDYVFNVIEKVNDLIKGYHKKNPDKHRRFVIDSVKNSMELLYLKERYNAFYTIAIHNDGKEKNLILHKVAKATYDKRYEDLKGEELGRVDFLTEKIHNLNMIEKDKDDFEKGMFFGPDVSRCVTESEIHIAVRTFDDFENEEKLYKEKSFYSTSEQWMKLYSLIIRPGLITPSRDERCMAIAYVAKFNSGCISRQVGCTIVDEQYAVQSVGWNDPPSGQLPCQLRYIDELCDDARILRFNKENHIYSKYETEGMVKLKDKKQKRFIDCIKEDYRPATFTELSKYGLRYSYCFRSRYNEYRDIKDQVNTRSLHAEENTMLRISKEGGNGLKNGTMYVTASPCVLCSKKAYQIGIREIVYLDPYSDIAPELIIDCGWSSPRLKPFMGAIGTTFYKLYQPFLPYKDELSIWEKCTEPRE